MPNETAMHEDLLFKLVFVIFYVSTAVIRYPYLRANRQNRISRSKRGVREQLLLGVATLGMAVLPLLYVLTPWFSALDYSVWMGWRMLGAVLLFFPTLWLFYRAHHDLGRNWSVTLEIREGHTLVREGVYRRIRHPMYTALWLAGLLIPLVLTNWIGGWSTLVSFGILYAFRIGQEERMMREQFGADYELYQRETKRLVPFLF